MGKAASINATVIQVEKMVLGGLIVKPENLALVSLILEPGDFLDPRHGRIFRRLIELNNQGQQADLLTVYQSFNGEIDVDVIRDLIDEAFPQSADVWARKIREFSRRRKAAEMLHDSIDRMGVEGFNLEDQIDLLSDEFQALMVERQGLLSIESQMVKIIKKIENRKPVDFIKFGFASVDQVVGGVERGELWIIAGRPSMGKSASSANIMLNMARNGTSVCYVTVEGTNGALAMRLCAIESGVPLTNIRRGQMVDADWNSVQAV